MSDKWSPEEDALLVVVYETKGLTKAVRLIDWRSPSAVKKRIRLLGLSDYKYSRFKVKIAYLQWNKFSNRWSTFESMLVDIGLAPKDNSYIDKETFKWVSPKKEGDLNA